MNGPCVNLLESYTRRPAIQDCTTTLVRGSQDLVSWKQTVKIDAKVLLFRSSDGFQV